MTTTSSHRLLLLAVLCVAVVACSSASRDLSSDSANAVAPNVLAYDLQPDESKDTTYGVNVSAGGQAVSVPLASFHDVDYGRFEAASFPVTLDIALNRPLVKEQIQILPLPAAGSAIDPASVLPLGNVLHLTLSRPANLNIALNMQKRLFLFAYSPDPGPSGANVVDAHAAGAQPNGDPEQTRQVLQAQIDKLSAGGGGTLFVPAGTFVTGTLTLKDNVTLHLHPRAVLKASSNPKDYPPDDDPVRGSHPGDPAFHERSTDPNAPSADQRFTGQFMTFSRLILVEGKNVAIRGHGRIDGNGTLLRGPDPNGLPRAVPNIIRVRSSASVTIEDVFLRNSAAWTLHLLASHDIQVKNVRIVNNLDLISTDGIDVDSSQHVTIDGAFIHGNDDGVCLKVSNNGNLHAPVDDVHVTGAVVSARNGAALKLGTESQENMSNVVFEKSEVYDSDRAMSIVVRDGAIYNSVAYKSITVRTGVTHLIEQVIGVRASNGSPMTCDNPKQCGVIERLSFQDIVAPDWTPPKTNWTFYMQFREDNQARLAAGEPIEHQQNDPGIKAFQGAKTATTRGKPHALTGLQLLDFVIAQKPLAARKKNPDSANEWNEIANLTIDDDSIDLDEGPPQ